MKPFDLVRRGARLAGLLAGCAALGCMPGGVPRSLAPRVITGQGVLTKSRVHSAPEMGGITDVVLRPARAGAPPELVVAFTGGGSFLDPSTFGTRSTLRRLRLNRRRPAQGFSAAEPPSTVDSQQSTDVTGAREHSGAAAWGEGRVG